MYVVVVILLLLYRTLIGYYNVFLLYYYFRLDRTELHTRIYIDVRAEGNVLRARADAEDALQFTWKSVPYVASFWPRVGSFTVTFTRRALDFGLLRARVHSEAPFCAASLQSWTTKNGAGLAAIARSRHRWRKGRPLSAIAGNSVEFFLLPATRLCRSGRKKRAGETQKKNLHRPHRTRDPLAAC